MSRVDALLNPRRRKVAGALAAAALVGTCLAAGGASAFANGGPPVITADEVQHGPVIARGNSNAGHAHGGSTLLVWHNGAVMTSAAVTSIYWGTGWGNSSFVGDKIAGLDSFYSGIGETNYIGTNTEYAGVGGQKVTRAVSYNSYVTDTSPTPRGAPSTSAVLAVVARKISSPVENGYYPVYSDIPRGHAGYCAWHSYGTINGVPVQFAFFFNLDGDSGCSVTDTAGHSQGLAALANVSGHELSEALTDPRNGGWYDSSGAENADKCAWSFHGAESFANGSQWMIQGNFSNAAYAKKNGYDGGGCINGN